MPASDLRTRTMSFVSFVRQSNAHSIFVLLGLSIVIFIISRILPGDPARMAVGARAPQWVVDNLREQMHLDEPLLRAVWLLAARTPCRAISASRWSPAVR